MTLGLYIDNDNNGGAEGAVPATLIAQTNEVQITASNTWLYGDLQSPVILQAPLYWVAIETNNVNKVLYYTPGNLPEETACPISYSTTLPGIYPTCMGGLTSAYFYTSVVAGSLNFTNGQSAQLPNANYPVTGQLPSPSTGWSFLNWLSTGGVSCSPSNANPTSCTVSGSGSIQEDLQAQITFNTNPATEGTMYWDSCSGTGYTNGGTLVSGNFGANAVCYVPTGYSISSWACTPDLSCGGSSDVTPVTFAGPGTITLNLKSGSISSPAQTNITATPSNSTPKHGTMFTVSGQLRLVSTGVGIGNEPVECVFSWSTSIVTAITQTGASLGNYTCTATAPTTTGPYDVDVFFLGDYSGSPQYLPSKATAMITVT